MKNTKLSRIALLLCFLGMTLLAKAEPDPNYHIYICWGQSNMEGNAPVPNSETQGIDERFRMFYTAENCGTCGKKKGSEYTAVPPLARCFHGQQLGFGPVDYFGRTLVKNLDENIKVGVVVVAVGGCSIELFQKSRYQSYLSSAAGWLQNYAKSYGSNPYGRLIEVAKEAQKVGVIKGILVHQGESNTNDSNWPRNLKGVYEDMLKDLGLKGEDVPLLVGEVRYTGPCRSHNNVVRQVPNVIPNSYVISADGCEAANDDYHFTVAGYKLLGQRYAETMLKVLKANGGDSPQGGLSVSAFIGKDNAPGSAEIMIKNSNSDIQRITVYADNKQIGTGESVSWENIPEGEHSVYAIGYDSQNKEYKSAAKTITIMPEQKPYNGTPFKIPGKIEAEEFDLGGEGNAYHDNDEQNRNGGDRNEGVDMSNTAVGYTQTGEWLEYTVDVAEDGDYIVESRVASGNSGAAFTLYMDNQFIIPGADGTPGGFVEVPNTGDWETFTTVKTKLNKLTKGTHVLKLEITGDWVDIDYLEIKKASDGGQDSQGGGETQGGSDNGELLTGVTLGQYVDIKVQNRTISIYAPKGAHTNRPLLISCHGRDQDINYQRRLTQWETVADTADFIVAYPSAIQRGSNVDWDINGTDDTKFIQEVIDVIYKTYKVDLSRVYLSGFSMGGMFTYHCMKTIPDVFAAFAPISGYWDANVNNNARPLPLIHTHGTSDGVVQFQGNGNWAGAENVVKAWAKHNKTTETSTYKVESANVTKYSGGECEADVILAAVPGRDHEPTNNGYHTSREIWRFVSQYSTACGKSKASLKMEIEEIANNDPGEVVVSVSILDESIKSVEIFLDNKKVGDGTSKVTLSDLAEGNHTITAIGYNSNKQEAGNVKKNFTIFPPQTPFNGTPATIPGKIEAEEFDFGGEGNAYHDTDEQNRNKGDRNEGVDMSNTAVGYVQSGEWIEYTVDVETAGTYEVEVMTASENGTCTFQLSMDNEPITEVMTAAKTGDYTSFTGVKANTSTLSKGTHILKLEFLGDWMDVDYMTFKLIKAEETDLMDASAEGGILNGEFLAFDVTGRFIKNVTIENGFTNQLKMGFYILKNTEGKSYSILIGK